MRCPWVGHVGASVSALVDGQLDPAATERAWSHVLGCRACRRLVEQEGRIKTELATLACNEPSAQLMGSLYALDDTARAAHPSRSGLEAWATVDEIERRGSGRRRAGMAIVGAGSAAAVFGFASLSGATLGITGSPGGAPTASLSRPTSSPSSNTAVIAPVAQVHGRLSRTATATSAVLLRDR